MRWAMVGTAHGEFLAAHATGKDGFLALLRGAGAKHD